MGKIWKILLIFIICFGAFNIFVLFSNKAETQQALYSVYEDSFFSTAYLIKEETNLSEVQNEKAKLYVSEGERVAKGQEVLALLDGEGDTTLQNELDSVTERIKAIEEAADTPENAILLTDEIKKKNNQIIYYNSRGDMKTVAELKNEILLLINKKNAAVNEDNSELLTQLKTRKNELESTILSNKKSTLYAPCSGALFIGNDGLEQTLTPKEIDSLTADALREKLEAKSEMGGYKLINNYTFYVAFIVKNEDAQQLEKESVKIRFPDHSEKAVKANFVKLEQGEKESLVIYKCTEDIGLLLGMREIDAEIVRHTYEGFKIPRSAVKNNDGLTGVYVDSLGRQEFREIEIIYKQDTFVMASPSGEKPLALYDNIIVD